MAVSDAKKKASAKWDKANRKNISCMVSNAEHAAFKAYAEQRGLTVSGALLEYVRKCLADMEQTERLREPTEQTSGAD